MLKRFSDRRVIGVDVTVSLTAYSAFDCVGGKLTFSDAIPTVQGNAAIVGARLFDRASQAHPYEIFIFDQDPSASTFTDNGGITINDADLSKVAGIVTLPASARFAFADNSVSYTDGLYIPIFTGGLTTFYAAIRTGTAGTPTYVATNDVRLEFVLEM